MRIIRAILALFFAALIVIGIRQYFQQTTTIGAQDGFQRVRYKIADSSMVQRAKQFFSLQQGQLLAQPTGEKKKDIALLLAKKAEQSLKNPVVVSPEIFVAEDDIDVVEPIAEENDALEDLLPSDADTRAEEELIEERLGNTADTDSVINDISDVLHPDYSTGVLSNDDVVALTSIGMQQGNTEGEIVWLHYCDFDVSYCEQGMEEDIATLYTQTYVGLSYILKPFPPTSKSDDVLPHRAALCLGDMGTSDQFTRFYEALYAQPESRLSVERMIGLARSFGISDLGSCIDSKQYDFVIQQEKTLAKKLFALRALPANVFINKKSGSYILVPGYYTYEEIVPAIQWAVNNY